MSATTKPVTAADLLAMGEDAPFELIRGELRRVSPTDAGHWIVSGLFAMEFTRYSDSGHPGFVLAGEGGFFAKENPDIVIAPDVAFMFLERVREIGDRGSYTSVPPNAVVEVLSPSNTRKDIADKVRIYLDNGVDVVLVAHPKRETITAHFSDGRVRIYRIGEDLDLTDVLPDFCVPVAKFFE